MAVERPRIRPTRRCRATQIATFLVTLLHPVIYGIPVFCKDQPIKAAYRKHPYIPPGSANIPPQTPSPIPLQKTKEAVSTTDPKKTFINALVQAGRCRQHSNAICSASLKSLARRPLVQLYNRPPNPNYRQRRQLHNATCFGVIRPKGSLLSREECLSLVDFYAEHSTLSANSEKDADLTKTAPDDLQIDSAALFQEDGLSLLKNELQQTAGVDQSQVEHVGNTLEQASCTHVEAWDAYQSLPSPGLGLLPDWSKHRLLQRLAVIKKKDQTSMFRYLSVMDDMQRLDVPLTMSEWSSAVAFAGHGYSRITGASVEAALLKWREMKNDHNIQSGHVTFNILFDLATKAGKFVLADMIFKEMQKRLLRVDRFARVGLIYYQGMKGDGDGVRQAYRELVDAGEIVDTVVMNCVIVSLIRAGEIPAAEHVFERMKQVLSRHTGMRIPHVDWREVRDLGRVLDQAAQKHRNDPEERQKIQDQQFLAPCQQTFAIFVEHHATKTGELRRIASLVTEMQHFGIPLEGRIFVRIFKGFANHGGVPYSAWTKARLRNVWDALLAALDQKIDMITLDRWLAVWVVRAFERCFGHDQTLVIWEELRKRWKGDFRELGAVQSILKRTMTESAKRAGEM